MKKIFANKKILYIVLSIVVLLVGGSSFLAGYYIATTNNKTKVIIKEDLQTKEALKALQKLVDENKQKTLKEDSLKKEENSSKLVNSEVIDYQENSKTESTQPHIKPIIYTHKPKLVIIMDDISFNNHIKSLKKLQIHITPSFFPPSKRHPNTSFYAKQFKHYMVHFPMQATSKTFPEEEKTLHIDSSYSFILNRVQEIKKEFPNVKFVNNHTGSKFTADLKSMKKLYKALNKETLIFIDSKTTSKTKAPLVAKEANQLLLSRDVFLDNKADIKYIQKQLEYAIHLAQKKGYAIAICHPHLKTFQALQKSKKILNSSVEVIYIDELYKLIQQNKISKL